MFWKEPVITKVEVPIFTRKVKVRTTSGMEYHIEMSEKVRIDEYHNGSSDIIKITITEQLRSRQVVKYNDLTISEKHIESFELGDIVKEDTVTLLKIVHKGKTNYKFLGNLETEEQV